MRILVQSPLKKQDRQWRDFLSLCKMRNKCRAYIISFPVVKVRQVHLTDWRLRYFNLRALMKLALNNCYWYSQSPHEAESKKPKKCWSDRCVDTKWRLDCKPGWSMYKTMHDIISSHLCITKENISVWSTQKWQMKRHLGQVYLTTIFL
jgi:hypothetical protein